MRKKATAMREEQLWTDKEWRSFSPEERHRLNLAYDAGAALAAQGLESDSATPTEADTKATVLSPLAKLSVADSSKIISDWNAGIFGKVTLAEAISSEVTKRLTQRGEKAHA